MRQIRLLAVAALVAFGVALHAGSASAQWGAIAYDQNNCAWGDSWNYGNSAQAASVAMSECKQAGCRVLAQIGPGQCGALAVTASCRGWGWATRGTRAAAELGAMQECQHYNSGQCTLKVSDCNR